MLARPVISPATSGPAPSLGFWPRGEVTGSGSHTSSHAAGSVPGCQRRAGGVRHRSRSEAGLLCPRRPSGAPRSRPSAAVTAPIRPAPRTGAGRARDKMLAVAIDHVQAVGRAGVGFPPMWMPPLGGLLRARIWLRSTAGYQKAGEFDQTSYRRPSSDRSRPSGQPDALAAGLAQSPC
jgi:hypothetical protein